MKNQVINKVFIPVFCIMAATLSIAANYPGLMSPDSDFQYIQAVSRLFSDWHPPIMSIVWSYLLLIIDGPAGMLFLFSALFWSAVVIIAQSLNRESTISAITLLLLSVSPFVVNYLGTIWKDVFVFTFYFFGLALILRSFLLEKPLTIWLSLFIITIFVLGALARHNAIFSGYVLSIMCILNTTYFVHQIKKHRFMYAAAVALIAFIGLIFAANLLIESFVQVERKYASSSLFLYDLVGMSLRANEYLLPESSIYTLEYLENCYENKGWDRIWVVCSPLISELYEKSSWNNLYTYWSSAVLEYPGLYIKHRLYYFSSFFEPAWLVFNSEPTQMNVDMGFRETHLHKALKDYVNYSANKSWFAFLFTNGFWILFNCAMLLYGSIVVFLSKSRAGVHIFLVALSGFFYSAPLILGGVAPDFRYVYWSVGASIVFIPLAIYDYRKKDAS